jgi:hypothetical protein
MIWVRLAAAFGAVVAAAVAWLIVALLVQHVL